MCRDDHTRRLIFALENGMIKVNCGWDAKFGCTVNKTRIMLPLIFDGTPISCALYVKTEVSAASVKNELEKYFLHVCWIPAIFTAIYYYFFIP